MSNVIEKLARAIYWANPPYWKGGDKDGSVDWDEAEQFYRDFATDRARAALQALDGELFYILDEGSEPEVGDLVLASWVDEPDSEWEHQGAEYLVITSRRPNALGGKDFYEGQKPFMESNYNLWPGTAMKIIQRNGLPCIYRNQLEANKEGKDE